MRIILLLLISGSLFGQIDSMKVNILYMHSENHMQRTVDSVNLYNGYPRQNTNNYAIYEYDSAVSMYSLILDKPTEKYLKGSILEATELPTVRIPLEALTESAETKLNDEIYTNNWNAYIKNNNVWIFNTNQSADDTFTENQRNYIISIGGELYNFD
jgi:hypothetical protein